MATFYLTPAELPTYYDSRRILGLASDTGTPAGISDLSNSASAAYAFVNNCIQWASSEIDSMCQQGKRYARSDLEQIITDADAVGATDAQKKRAALLKQLAADLAYGNLMSRRGFAADSLRLLAPRYEAALILLDRLGQGIQVFDVEAAIEAGRPHRITIGLNSPYRPSVDNRMFGIWPDSPYSNAGWFGRW